MQSIAADGRVPESTGERVIDWSAVREWPIAYCLLPGAISRSVEQQQHIAQRRNSRMQTKRENRGKEQTRTRRLTEKQTGRFVQTGMLATG